VALSISSLFDWPLLSVQAQQAFAREALEKLQKKMQRKNKGAWKDELEKVS
jgi:hypothetical protein